MNGTKFPLQKWYIVAFTALVVGTMVGAIWIWHGINEQGMRMAIRATGRTSCLLFLSAFIASSLHRLITVPFSTWLLKNRRYLGISMAVSHTYHAIALFGLWLATSGTAPTLEPLGTFGYVLLISMTVTSFKASAAWLGKRRWKILHTTGMHFLWFGLAMILRLATSRMQKIATAEYK
jgi:methionine sulfoxide reductase heme-binding subunit